MTSYFNKQLYIYIKTYMLGKKIVGQYVDIQCPCSLFVLQQVTKQRVTTQRCCQL